MSRTRRFLVPLFLLALFSLAAHGAPQKEVRKTLPLAANGRVEIDTYKGSIDVTAEDRADVVVEARVVADTDCGDEKSWAEWVEATEVRIDAHSDLVLIESSYGRLEEYRQGFLSWCTARPFVHYRIRMPRTASLDIKDYKSTIDVASLAGRLRLESYKGKMRVSGLDGRLDLETYKGTARVEFARLAGDSPGRDLQGGDRALPAEGGRVHARRRRRPPRADPVGFRRSLERRLAPLRRRPPGRRERRRAQPPRVHAQGDDPARGPVTGPGSRRGAGAAGRNLSLRRASP